MQNVHPRTAKELIESLSDSPEKVAFVLTAISDKIQQTLINRKKILKNDEEFKLSGMMPHNISGDKWVETANKMQFKIDYFLNPFDYDKGKRI